MAEVEQGRFVCAGCGKQYRWKPELAGKKAKCGKCGAVMQVPAQAPGAPEDSLYDLAPDESAPKRLQPAAAASAGSADDSYRCPSCKQSIAPGSVICVKCGFNLREGKKMAPVRAAAASSSSGGRPVIAPMPMRSGAAVLPYGAKPLGAKAGPSLEDSIGGEAWRELYLPIALLLAGFAAQVAIGMHQGGDFNQSLPIIGVRLAINLVLTFIGILIVAKLMEVSFGAVGPAIIKLCAICLLVPGLSYWIGYAVGSDSGFVHMMVASTMTFPLGLVAFKTLFDMEFIDVIYCVVIISLVNDWIMMFLMGILFNSIGGGGGF